MDDVPISADLTVNGGRIPETLYALFHAPQRSASAFSGGFMDQNPQSKRIYEIATSD